MRGINKQLPLPLPGRRFGRDMCRRVQYDLTSLGPLGFLLRWHRKGRPSLEIVADLKPLFVVFDHAEFWMSYGPEGRQRSPDRRVLVGHPYHFTDNQRACLGRLAKQLGLMWMVIPPGDPTACVTSWYSKHAWMIIVQAEHAFLGAPEDGEVLVPSAKCERRLLKQGETIDELNQLPRSATVLRKRPAPYPRRTTVEKLRDRITIRDAIVNPLLASDRLREIQLREAEAAAREAAQRERHRRRFEREERARERLALAQAKLERKAQEVALREARKRLKLAQESLNIGADPASDTANHEGES